DEERRAARLVAADVEHLRDVLRLDRARRARLDLEPRRELGIARELARDDLDRDAATRPRVARLVDLAHPALAELADDRVLVADGGSDHWARSLHGIAPGRSAADHVTRSCATCVRPSVGRSPHPRARRSRLRPARAAAARKSPASTPPRAAPS